MSNDQALEDDLDATACWLAAHNPGVDIRGVVAHRHYSQHGHDLCAVIALHLDREIEHRLTAEAHTAMRALGWRFERVPGSDVEDTSSWWRLMSAHEQISAVARVESALARVAKSEEGSEEPIRCEGLDASPE